MAAPFGRSTLRVIGALVVLGAGLLAPVPWPDPIATTRIVTRTRLQRGAEKWAAAV